LSMEEKTQAIDEKEVLIEKILRWAEKQKQQQQASGAGGDA